VFKCEKQRSFKEFSDIALKLIEVEVPGFEETQCVLVDTDESQCSLSDDKQVALRVLDNGGEATATEWQKRYAGSGGPERTFYRLKKELFSAGLVLCDKEPGERGAKFRISPIGKMKLGISA